MSEYKYLSEYERRIIIFLYFVKGAFSTRAISNLLSIHELTAKKYLEDLEKKEVVKKEIKENKNLWRLNKLFSQH